MIRNEGSVERRVFVPDGKIEIGIKLEWEGKKVQTGKHFIIMEVENFNKVVRKLIHK